MNKKLLVLVIVGCAALFVAAGIYAKTIPDVIELNDPAYKVHKKGVVHFEHGKHQKEYVEKYPEFYKNGCGDCHHDKDNKPLSDLKEGDEVKKCIECHKIAAEMPKKEKPLHENCRVCHKGYNKKYKPKKKAPTTCTKCHPKKKK
jgi:uncharacterized CHY-type Zn-finger protein